MVGTVVEASMAAVRRRTPKVFKNSFQRD